MRRLARLAVVLVGVAAVTDRLLGRRAVRAERPSARPISSLVVVDAPIEIVWAAVTEIASQPLWMREMKAVRIDAGAPVGLGTRGEADVRILGVRVTDPVEITAWQPPRRFAIRHLGRFAGAGVIELEPNPDGTTTVRWDETLVPPVLPDLGASVLRPILGRIFLDDLHRFADLVEAGRLPSRG